MALDSHDLSSFGAVLKEFRARRHLTQQQLATKLGVRRNTIGSWERGDFLPASKAQMLELARHLRLDDQETRQLLEASLTALAPHWSVPLPRNPYFTGREEILEALHKQLGVEQAVAITQSSALHGLGGVGKTQIALEYTYRHALEYSAVFWIGAETEEQIIASLLHVAETLQLPERAEKDQQLVLTAVQRWLSTHSQWLLIWDNMEDLRVLDRFLPSVRSGAILITTRCQTLGTLAQGIDLMPMEPGEGMLFLLRRAKLLSPEATCEDVRHLAQSRPTEHAVASELVTVLGGLSLALDQAGAYLEATRCGLPAYLDLFRARRATLLQLRGEGARDHPASVSTTFTLSLTATIQRHPAVGDLLRVCALLQPDAIPEELFRQGCEHLGSALVSVCGDPLEWDRLLGVACSYSLLARQPETCTLSLHRLVQAVLWEAMGKQERNVWQWHTIRALNTTFPEIMPENWRQCERFLPHLLAVTAAIPHDAIDPDLAEVLRKTADYLRGRARFEQAEPLYQRALHIEGQLAGPDQLRMATPLYGLALLYYEQGKYTQAEPLAQRALSLWEHALSPQDPELARPLIGLAIIYFAQGQYAQTELLCQRALWVREQALGHEHPLLIAPLSNLAEVYNEQGKYAQAESLYQQVMRIQEQTLGAEHPQMAYPLYGLGRLYTRQGKDEQAEALYRRALRVREQTLGMEHPYLAEPLTGLALIAFRQGKEEQAETLYLQALRVGERTWGPKHPELAPPLLNLADLYAKQGKDEQAETLYRRVQCIWEQEVGVEHPLLAIALSNLATLAVGQGRVEEAEALYMQALHILEQRVGQQHPDTAQTLHDLALLRKTQGHLSEAISLAEQALQIQGQSLGEAHSKTVATRTLYAQLLQEQADGAEPTLEHIRTLLRERGWSVHLKKQRSKFYVYATRKVGGHTQSCYLAPLDNLAACLAAAQALPNVREGEKPTVA